MVCAMRWIDMPPLTDMDPAAMAMLARQGVARQPDNLAMRLSLALSLYKLHDHAAAVAEYEQVLALDPAGFADWHRLSHGYAELGRFDDALAAGERGVAARPDFASVWLRYGEALRKRGREDEARGAFERCVALGDEQYRGLRALLRPLALREDGAALLDTCDAMPAKSADNALVRANRAIALSRMGRVAEARALIDLDRHIVQVPIDPPDGFASVAALNDAIVREASGQRDLRGAAAAMDITYCPVLTNRPALRALLGVIRAELEMYLQGGTAANALPSSPTVAQLFYGVTVLRDAGSNGEHIHDYGRVSAVYHVQIPEEIIAADDHRGSLSVGDCSVYTGGHAGCWGKRLFKPQAGVLTLFPSHFFHDVVPSGTSAPRVSIAADMIAVEP